MAGPSIGTWVKVKNKSGKLTARVIPNKDGGKDYEQGQIITQSEFNRLRERRRARQRMESDGALPYIELVTDVKGLGKGLIQEARNTSKENMPGLLSRLEKEAFRLDDQIDEDIAKIKKQYADDRGKSTSRSEKKEAKARYDAAIDEAQSRKKEIAKLEYQSAKQIKSIVEGEKVSPVDKSDREKGSKRTKKKAGREFLTPEQSTERLRRDISAATNNAQRSRIIGKYIRENELLSSRRQEQGMQSAELMSSVDFAGIRIHYPPGTKGRSLARKIINEVYDLNLPNSLTKHTKEVILSSGRNKHDSYYEEKYGVTGITSAASGGNNRVVFYNGKVGKNVLAHEMGHNFAKSVYGDFEPSKGSRYSAAYTKEPKVSAYSAFSGSKAEDFAEAVGLYFSKPSDLQREFPLKYQVIDNLIKTGKEDG